MTTAMKNAQDQMYTSGQVGMSVNEFSIMHELKVLVKCCGTCITFRNFFNIVPKLDQ